MKVRGDFSPSLPFKNRVFIVYNLTSYILILNKVGANIQGLRVVNLKGSKVRNKNYI
jgi:hypothetical protein